MFGHTDKVGNLQSQNSLKTFFAYEHHDLVGGGEPGIGAGEEATLSTLLRIGFRGRTAQLCFMLIVSFFDFIFLVPYVNGSGTG